MTDLILPISYTLIGFITICGLGRSEDRYAVGKWIKAATKIILLTTLARWAVFFNSICTVQ